jgi:hypothetical protein
VIERKPFVGFKNGETRRFIELSFYTKNSFRSFAAVIAAHLDDSFRLYENNMVRKPDLKLWSNSNIRLR